MNTDIEKLEILKELKHLSVLFESKITYDDQKNKIIDRLHGELQDYKEDLYKKIIKPLLIDIIQIKSNIEKTERYYRENEESNNGKLLDLINSFSLEIGDLLEKYDIKIYKCKSDIFEPLKQRVVKTIETNKKELDKKIAKSYSYCYEMDNKVINPEKVAVFLYKNENNE